MEELKFSLQRKEIPVILDDKPFKLKELSGKQRDEFLNNLGKRMEYVEGKVAGMTNYEGLQAALVSLCLHDENGEQVPESVVQDYPAIVQSKLFKAAQELNGLDEKAMDEAKND